MRTKLCFWWELRLQVFLHRPNDSIDASGMRLVSSKDWVGSKPKLFLVGGDLGEADRISCFNSCILLGGRISGEISSRIQKTRLAFINLSHIWLDSLFGYRSKVRLVLLYVSETWLLRTDVWRLSVFEQRCLLYMSRISCGGSVSNSEVRHKIPGSKAQSLDETLNRLRRLGHVLRMLTERQLRCALFFGAISGCSIGQGDQ